MGNKGEYIDFRFGNHWASDFNLVSVTNSDRYSPSTFGDFSANVNSVMGRRGVYKWKTQIDGRIIGFNIAFDNLDITSINSIKEWLDPDKVEKLYLSEEPYKYYYACLNQDIVFDYVPFKTEEVTVGENVIQRAVYKGEIQIDFICLDNLGYSDYDCYEKIIPIWEYKEHNRITVLDEANTLADGMDNSQDWHYTIVSNMKVDDKDESSYTWLDDEAFVFVSDGDLTEEQQMGIYNYYEDNDMGYFDRVLIMNLAQPDQDKAIVSNPLTYDLQSDFTHFNVMTEMSTKYLNPWVLTSNLMNVNGPYKQNNVYLASHFDEDTGDAETSGISINRPFYMLNSGTTEANLNLTFDLINISEGMPLDIVVEYGYFVNSGDDSIKFVSKGIQSEIIIKDFSKYKPFYDAYQQEKDGWYIELDSVLKELYVKNKNNENLVFNLNRYNKDHTFLDLASCKFVDYTKPFPTSLSKVKYSAIENTVFNKIYVKDSLYRLKNVTLDWKHTYL